MKAFLSILFCAALLALSARPGCCAEGVRSGAPRETVLPGIVPRPPVLPPVRLEAKGAERPVELRELAFKAEIVGSLARTAVEMTFYNPNSRVLEGELLFPLLDGQTVTGFALDMDGVMRDAVPVEKDKGRRVFEDVTRRKADPALLEAARGSSFKLRVYPINPGGTRKVRVVYVESLGGAAGRGLYVLPAAYAQQPERCSLEVSVRDGGGMEILRNPFGPLNVSESGGVRVIRGGAEGLSLTGGAFEAVFSGRENAAVLGQRGGERWLYVEIPDAPAAETPFRPKTLTVLWDASMSALKRDRESELAFLDALFRELKDADVRLRVVRDAPSPLREFRVAGGGWGGLRAALEAEPCDGATSLECFDTQSDGSELYLLFTDGHDNYSAGAMKAPRAPLYAVMSAPGGDAVKLRGLSEESGGTLVDLTKLSAADAARRLLRFTPLRVSVSGLSDAAVRREAGRFIAAAGALKGARAVTVTLRGPKGEKLEETEVPVPSGGSPSEFVPQIWASMRIDELSREYSLNRGEIRRLGKAFGLAARETSLIVLDSAEDYARYDITPPAELKKAVEALRAKGVPAAQAEKNKLARVLVEWDDYRKWWEKEFPKGPYVPPKPKADGAEPLGARLRFSMLRDSVSMPMEAAPAMEASEEVSRSLPDAPAPASAGENAVPADAGTAVRIQPWAPDSPYRDRMKAARTEDLYRIYLDERPDRQSSTAFFLDVSDLLAERGLNDLALRVLSNLAEMDLENRQVLRVLGCRLLQSGQTARAVVIFRKVLELCSDEPQSFRDLGLALERSGHPQEAVETLYEVVRRTFARRFPGIEVIALSEINAIASRRGGVDLAFMDRRFVGAMPLDLRVVLTWDSDNTDIDLHVTDPNGEEAYYGRALTYQGGRVSKDNTQGYGPEDYSLRTAKPGIYRVEVNFYGHGQQIISEATTIQLDFFTGWGRADQSRRSVTMRLKDVKDRIFVGEFEVKK